MRVLAGFVVVAASVALAAASPHAPRAAAPSASCIAPTQPAWIDYADKWVPFRRLFFHPGLAVALAHTAPAADARSGGAQVAYWVMSLKAMVGTPSHPANPSSVSASAARLAAAAVKVTNCDTPVVALNELHGARLQPPWSRSNAQYRANVLELVRALAEHGAQPHLLISESGATSGAAGDWWRSVAATATIVREVYMPAPALHALGASGATIYLRFQLRRAVRNFTTIGIPSSRVGLALGFHSGRGGRNGLGAAPWLGVVKREGLAARLVASELGLDSVWSWGWASFAGASRDPNKADAACVYLWARNPSLCDAPAVAGRGFDSSRAQPPEAAGRGNVRLRALSARHPVWLEVRAAAKLAARVAYVQQRTADGWRSVRRVILAPFHPMRLRLSLPNGPHVLRVSVAAESAPQGTAFSTAPLGVRVH